MAKLDYIKAILYGVMLIILSSVATLVATMIMTKKPELSLLLCFVVPAILLTIYIILILRIPEKIGFTTDEDQKYLKLKLALMAVIALYMISSLWIYYMTSQLVGKVMFLASPTFIIIGKAMDMILKKNNPTS